MTTNEITRQKLILIDGHAIIHRAFHAVPEDISTSTGEPVNATFGFTSMLMKALVEEKPDYIAVAFDLASPTFRHNNYALYKAHRPPLPENIKPQFSRIREVVQAFGIQIYEKDGFEADDILGTLSVQADQLGVETIIYTGDMDTLQLVKDHVSVKVAKRGISDVVEYKQAEVEARYSLHPHQLPDFKGLVGDPSDNIPGVPGIGEKTACRLLSEYGDLENVLAHINDLKSKEQKMLRAATEQARQSKFLATIILDVPIQLDLESCRLSHIDSEKVLTIFRQLEFRALVERALALFRRMGITVANNSSLAISGPSSEPSARLIRKKGGIGGPPSVISGTTTSAVQVTSTMPPTGVVPIIAPPLPPDEEEDDGRAKAGPSFDQLKLGGEDGGRAKAGPSFDQLKLGNDNPEQLQIPDIPLSPDEEEHHGRAKAGPSFGVGLKPGKEDDEDFQPKQLTLFDLDNGDTHAMPLSGSAAPTISGIEARQQTNTTIINTEEGLEALIRELQLAGAWAIDTETTSENVRAAALVGCSLAMTAGEAYYIPLGHTTTIDGHEPTAQLPLPYVLEKLRPLLEDKAIHKYMHNAKYDLTIFARYGINIHGLAFDTMLGAYLRDPGRRGLGLKDQAFQRLGIVMTPISDLIGSGSKMISMAQVAIRKAADYAGADADMTLRLVEPIRAELEQHNLMDLYNHIELPLISVLMQMELNGVALDAAFLREFGATLKNQLATVEQAIYQAVGHQFNINSTKQLAEVLFEELKLPKGKKTKTGYSVNVDVIESLRGKHAVIDFLLEYRQLSKLKSTYVDGLLELMDKTSGRVYTSFNQTITSSGRLSSSNPNLQNIPVRTEIGRQIRRAFIADPGHLLLTADYSQIELRILAAITHEPRLVEAFEKDEDIHMITAASLFNVPLAQVTKDQRRLAKTVVYAVLYGQSAFGLSQVTGMSNADSADFIKRYHETFPNIKTYVDSTLQQARSQGYVNTLYGRKRFIPDMHALSYSERQALEREAINMPIQGTNADLIKRAMLQLQHALQANRLKTRMILQVHDELVFEVPEEELEQAKRLIKTMMEHVDQRLQVPIKVEMKAGKNWFAAEVMA